MKAAITVFFLDRVNQKPLSPTNLPQRLGDHYLLFFILGLLPECVSESPKLNSSFFKKDIHFKSIRTGNFKNLWYPFFYPPFLWSEMVKKHFFTIENPFRGFFWPNSTQNGQFKTLGPVSVVRAKN